MLGQFANTSMYQPTVLTVFMKKREKRIAAETVQNTAELEAEVGSDPMVVVKRRNPIAMLWRALLFVIRIPEKVLGTIYRYSPIRMILYKMEWYRDLADQTEIETILEDTYGGASTRLMKLRHFIRRNILFTLLFCLGIYVAGITLMPAVLNHPSVRVALGQPIIDSDSRIKEIEHTRQVSQSIIARRGNLRTELEHCAVVDKTRFQLLSMLNSEARFSDPNAASSMAVIRRFITHLDQFDLKAATTDAQQRQRRVAVMLTGIADRVEQRLMEIDGREQQLRREVDRLVTQKRALDAADGIDKVNQSIKLRDDIDRQNAIIDAGPLPSDVSEAISRTRHLIAQLDHQQEEPIVSILDRLEPDWMTATVESSAENLETVIVEQNSRADQLIARLNSSSRPEVAAAVLDISTTLEEYSIVQLRASQLAAGLKDKLVQRQLSANQQISSFLNESSNQWLDYDACYRHRVAAD